MIIFYELHLFGLFQGLIYFIEKLTPMFCPQLLYSGSCLIFPYEQAFLCAKTFSLSVWNLAWLFLTEGASNAANFITICCNYFYEIWQISSYNSSVTINFIPCCRHRHIKVMCVFPMLNSGRIELQVVVSCSRPGDLNCISLPLEQCM